MAVDRCVWRTFDTRLNMLMRSGEFPGGRQSNHATDYYWTGIAVKKYVHPESKNGAWQRVVNFPYPLIRMADLYLSYAEAYNEYYGPDQKAYDKINAVRRRAGLRDVEDVWNDSSIVSEVGKHRTQDGLRDIIHTERMIELSYEGQRYWDICRWKRAEEFFHHPHSGLVRSRRQHLRRLLRAHHMAAARVDDPQELSAPDPRRRDQQEPQGGPEPGLLICLT